MYVAPSAPNSLNEKPVEDELSQSRYMYVLSSPVLGGFIGCGRVDLETDLIITQGSTRTFSIEIDVGSSAQPENSIGFSIAKPSHILTDSGSVSLTRVPPDDNHYDISYIENVPQSIKIDGAFADSQDVRLYNDYPNDVSKKSLDILECGYSNDNDALSFLLKVDGEIGWGSPIPERFDDEAPVEAELVSR